jgi:hypothetical protein
MLIEPRRTQATRTGRQPGQQCGRRLAFCDLRKSRRETSPRRTGEASKAARTGRVGLARSPAVSRSASRYDARGSPSPPRRSKRIDISQQRDKSPRRTLMPCAGSLGGERLDLTLEPLRTSPLPSYPCLRLHRCSFSEITLCARKGHTLFLNAPWIEHDCREACFRCDSLLVKIPCESRQSEGCISKKEARRRTAARNSMWQTKNHGRRLRERRIGVELRRAAKLGVGRFGGDVPSARQAARATATTIAAAANSRQRATRPPTRETRPRPRA